MIRGASARRHAQAVFQIAFEKKELEKWKAYLEEIAHAIAEPKFFSMMENPAVHFDDKAVLLKQKLDKISPEALNFTFLLLDKGRLRILPKVISEYNRMLDAHYGIERVQVVTALPLDHKEREEIKKSIESLLNKKVVMDNKVQEDIVGGLVIRIGDKLIDGSIMTKLKTLEKELVGIRR